MFSIVEFIESSPKEVELVPNCWLTDSGGCMWPPQKLSRQIARLIQNQQEPQADWSSFKVRTIATAGELHIVLQKSNYHKC